MKRSESIESFESIQEILKSKPWKRGVAPVQPTSLTANGRPDPAPIPAHRKKAVNETPSLLSEVSTEHQENTQTSSTSGRYDFDLAEFPLFRFYKNQLGHYDPKQPIVYEDTITGKNGLPIDRRWTVY